jgi:hypothetical protein
MQVVAQDSLVQIFQHMEVPLEARVVEELQQQSILLVKVLSLELSILVVVLAVVEVVLLVALA